MPRLFLLLILFCFNTADAVLKEIKGCQLSPTEWADGDSFEVLLPDGSKTTIRLYGADCIEMHVTGDDSNARRLRDQRRYFGINDILTAKSFGELAKVEIATLLSKPFAIHTSFADGRGDGRFKRIYAFVTTADGKDLSETLVSKGLARAFGVTRQRPDGGSGADWMERLKDLELTAARAGLGAWQQTDWQKLIGLREEIRKETAELDQARGITKVGENQPVDLNSAPRDQLMALPGVAEKTAIAIIEARPFTHLGDLERVPGIGPKTVERLKPFLTINNQEPPP